MLVRGQPSADAAVFVQVDIRFPQSGAPDPNCVTVTGLPENVEEAIDHILNLEEEYVSSGWASTRPWVAGLCLWAVTVRLPVRTEVMVR